MPVSRTSAQKNVLCTAYLANVAKVSLHYDDPGPSGTANENAGGSPAYARKAPPSGTVSPVNGVGSFQVIFDVAAGGAAKYACLWDAAGNLLDGGAVTPQPFGSQGTYALTVQYQQN